MSLIVSLLYMDYLKPRTVLFYLESKEYRNAPDEIILPLLLEIDSSFSSYQEGKTRKQLAEFFLDNNLAADYKNECKEIMLSVDKYSLELAKKLFLDKNFPKDCISKIIKNLNIRENSPNYTSKSYNIEQINSFMKNRVKFAEKLCMDKSLNCSIG